MYRQTSLKSDLSAEVLAEADMSQLLMQLQTNTFHRHVWMIAGEYASFLFEVKHVRQCMASQKAVSGKDIFYTHDRRHRRPAYAVEP